MSPAQNSPLAFFVTGFEENGDSLGAVYKVNVVAELHFQSSARSPGLDVTQSSIGAQSQLTLSIVFDREVSSDRRTLRSSGNFDATGVGVFQGIGCV